MSSGPKFLVIVALELLLVSVWATGASAVVYSTPLQPGNNALYQVSGSYSENVNTTEMAVLAVNGLNITATFKDRYYDLTETVSGFWLDIASGQRNSSNLIFAIGAGLNPGDTIPDGPSPPISIQSEQTRGCGGAQRLTNYATFQVTIAIGTRAVQGYWDKTSGIMCSFYFQDPGGELSMDMISTSLWAPTTPGGPDGGRLDPVPWVLLAVAAIPLALLAFFRVRKRTPRKRVRG